MRRRRPGRTGDTARAYASYGYIAVLSTLVLLAAPVVWAGAAEPGDANAPASDDVGNSSSPETPPAASAAVLPETPSLDDYLAYAGANNAGLAASYYSRLAAQARIPQARTLPDPVFKYEYERSESDSSDHSHEFELSQMFPWFGKRGLAGEVAAQSAQAASSLYEAARLKVRYDVKIAYYEYYYLARAIETTRDTLELMTRLESVARTAYAAEQASYADVVRAQLELGRLEDDLRSMIDMRSSAVARLNAAINRPSGEPLPWPDAIPLDEATISDEAALAALVETSPELAAMAGEIGARSRSVELAHKQFLPDIMLGVSYMDMGRMMSAGGMSRDADSRIMGMVSLNIPVWRDKYRAAEAEAKAMYLEAVHLKVDRENRLSAAVKMALFGMRDAARKIDLYRTGLIPKARQSLAAAETAFAAGKADFLDLVDAERVWLEFELSYQRSLVNHAEMAAELEMLLGRSLADAGKMTLAVPSDKPDLREYFDEQEN